MAPLPFRLKLRPISCTERSCALELRRAAALCGIPRARRVLVQDAPWNGLRSSHAARRSHRYCRHACHRSRHHRRPPSRPPRGPRRPTAPGSKAKPPHSGSFTRCRVLCGVCFVGNRRSSSGSNGRVCSRDVLKFWPKLARAGALLGVRVLNECVSRERQAFTQVHP